MPIAVTFTYVTQHRFQNVHGAVSVTPGLGGASPRLYVIYNDATNRPFYIGTAQNLTARFAPRNEALREVGFDHATVANAIIWSVQIQVDGVNRPPDNAGRSMGIDVEHLLIRTYISHIDAVRNIQKVAQFTNTSGQRLDWSLVNNAGIANFGVHNYSLANNASL